MSNDTDQPTTEKLANALAALNDPRLNHLISRARSGFYCDFKSPLVTPKVDLIRELRSFGHQDFASRVLRGDFDSTVAEGEAWLATLGTPEPA